MLRHVVAASAVLCVTGTLAGGVVRAQSLGDIAAREAKRRAAAPHAAKVVTDKDLPDAKAADPAKPTADDPSAPTPVPAASTAPLPAPPAAPRPAPPGPSPNGHCLGDAKVDSRVTRDEHGMVTVDWTIDVANYCAEPHDIQAVYQAFGADDALLQSDRQELSIDAKMRATASGRMLVPDVIWDRVTHRSGFARFR
jgi:hypothetical protein